MNVYNTELTCTSAIATIAMPIFKIFCVMFTLEQAVDPYVQSLSFYSYSIC